MQLVISRSELSARRPAECPPRSRRPAAAVTRGSREPKGRSMGQYRDRKIYQIDPQTGAILRTIESNRFVTGVTWIEPELWHGTWEGDESDLQASRSSNGRGPGEARDAARSGRFGARVRWRRSVLLRRRKEREGADRPTAQTRVLDGQRLRVARRLHEQVIEAALAGERRYLRAAPLGAFSRSSVLH